MSDAETWQLKMIFSLNAYPKSIKQIQKGYDDITPATFEAPPLAAG